jgi:hypothetical protein
MATRHELQIEQYHNVGLIYILFEMNGGSAIEFKRYLRNQKIEHLADIEVDSVVRTLQTLDTKGKNKYVAQAMKSTFDDEHKMELAKCINDILGNIGEIAKEDHELLIAVSKMVDPDLYEILQRKYETRIDVKREKKTKALLALPILVMLLAMSWYILSTNRTAVLLYILCIYIAVLLTLAYINISGIKQPSIARRVKEYALIKLPKWYAIASMLSLFAIFASKNSAIFMIGMAFWLPAFVLYKEHFIILHILIALAIMIYANIIDRQKKDICEKCNKWGAIKVVREKYNGSGSWQDIRKVISIDKHYDNKGNLRGETYRDQYVPETHHWSSYTQYCECKKCGAKYERNKASR